jgi:hypothetical protein
MPRVLTCTTWNETTQACDAQAWVEQPASPFPTMTLAEGQQIGDSIVYACVAITIVKLFFKPSTHRRS